MADHRRFLARHFLRQNLAFQQSCDRLRDGSKQSGDRIAIFWQAARLGEIIQDDADFGIDRQTQLTNACIMRMRRSPSVN